MCPPFVCVDVATIALLVACCMCYSIYWEGQTFDQWYDEQRDMMIRSFEIVWGVADWLIGNFLAVFRFLFLVLFFWFKRFVETFS